MTQQILIHIEGETTGGKILKGEWQPLGKKCAETRLKNPYIAFLEMRRIKKVGVKL